MSNTKQLIKLLEEEYFNGSQSIEYRGIFQFDEHKVKISIDRDSYDKQSSAIARIWSQAELKWNFLASIPYSLMAVCTDDVFCYGKAEEIDLNFGAKRAFTKDIRTLKEKCKKILR